MRFGLLWAGVLCGLIIYALPVIASAERPVPPVENSTAASVDQMKPYTELIQHTDATIELVPIPGGTFLMGSPEDEDGREDGEGPQVNVRVDPFWMGKYEITWDAFDIWVLDSDVALRKAAKLDRTPFDDLADEYQLYGQPTPPYEDMTFGMGHDGYPAICMTQFAGKIFCKWLSAKTGRYYRLPTEAEWEFACRGGSDTAYSFGDDADDLEDHAWFYDNADEVYHAVGLKKPNAFGLYDMHGNVSEWVLDQYEEGFGVQGADQTDADQTFVNPLNNPKKLYPRVVKGGSWNDDPEQLRSAWRGQSAPEWKKRDPQFPKSVWFHTDAKFVGFRIVRPLVEPTEQEQEDKWDKSEPHEDRKAGR